MPRSAPRSRPPAQPLDPLGESAWDHLQSVRDGRGLELAEQAVRAAKARVAHQAAVVEGFEIAGDEAGAKHARETLSTLSAGLAMAHLWWLIELASPERDQDAGALQGARQPARRRQA